MPYSLKALQAFEAAARTGSFAAAAADLSVTPAAVAQLVRSLERRLGRDLFVRVPRGVVPSEAAHEVLPRLHAVFEEIDRVCHRLAGTTLPSRLTVSVPTSIASGWLSHRIVDFLGTDAVLDVSLRSDDDPVAFERDRIDVRMSYGRFHYRGHGTSEVLLDAIYPVCSPAFLERRGPFGRAAALADVPLVHTDWGPAAATFPAWPRWFESARAGIDGRRLGRGPQANSSKVALELAVAGLGVSLVQGLLAADAVRRGTLVVAFPHALELGQPYCLTLAEHALEREVVRRFDAWFRAECAASAGYMATFASTDPPRESADDTSADATAGASTSP